MFIYICVTGGFITNPITSLLVHKFIQNFADLVIHIATVT